jgi:hypothetical protein
MKKLAGLITGLLLTVATFAQSGVTFTDASSAYDKTKATSFNFTLTEKYTTADIKGVASYYENYFSTTLNDSNPKLTKVKLTIVGENEMSRKVILRFFVGLEVKTISVNGVEMDRDEFVKKYIAL